MFEQALASQFNSRFRGSLRDCYLATIKNVRRFSMRYRLNQLTKVLWSAKGGAFALALMAVVLPGCINVEENRPVAQQPTAQQQENVTTEDVTEDTEALIGQTVTIRSEPEEKIGPYTFTLSDEQFFGGEPIIVVNTSGQPFTFPEDDDREVQVTGEVRNFVIADINRSYNLGLEPNLYTNYENQPAIIAQSIAVAPKPGEITENPQRFYGRTLASTGEVERVYGPNVFSLNDEEFFGGGQDLLVLVANRQEAQTPIREDETVAVTGVLRPFVVAELEREYDFNWDEGVVRQLEAEYKTRPVLVVDDVYPSALPDAAK
jgi:hypothetical protein